MAALAFLSGRCDLSTPQKPVKPVPPTDPKINIVIEGSEIRYNGNAMVFGQCLESWVAAIGTPSRLPDFWPDGGATWDDLGISVGVSRGHVIGLSFMLLPHDQCTTFLGNGQNSWPRQAFQGRLLLDRGWVAPDVDPREIESESPRFQETYTRRTFERRNYRVQPMHHAVIHTMPENRFRPCEFNYFVDPPGKGDLSEWNDDVCLVGPPSPFGVSRAAPSPDAGAPDPRSDKGHRRE